MKIAKIEELDILRAISALAVITIHVSAYFTAISGINTLKLIMVYIDNLAGFAVPSFLVISGMVLYKKYGEFNGSWGSFYKSRFVKILPIYLLFSFFFTLVPELSNIVNGRKVHLNLILVCYNLLTGGAFYHLWYFGLLFQLYLLYPFLMKLYNKYKIGFLIITLTLQILWTFCEADVAKYFCNLANISEQKLPLFVGHFFWFVFGFYFLGKKDQIVNKKWLHPVLLFSLILLVNLVRIYPMIEGMKRYKFDNIPANYYYFNNFLNPFYFLVEFLFFYKLSLFLMVKKTSVQKFFISVGNYSLEIYLIHPAVIILLVILGKHVGLTPVDYMFYPVLWLSTFTISYFLSLLYRNCSVFFKRVIFTMINLGKTRYESS